ncbi:hypothetical protein F2P81_011791 [Scophthalmus maximus]|uniref:Bactericidal permeability-increasing protein n=1 Tax=Scophthalmus maximus TaxID=52904 RepID=A0A6A4SUX0_SCOMX|nr:hypothetical protein F2P81_011791 [Scophthalmus maximus]
MLFSCAHGENPAIQVILTNKGLQYGKHAGTDWIQKMLEHVTLPDISGKVNVGFWCSIHYTLTNTSIEKCDLPEPSADFYPDATGLKTSMSGLSVALSGQWMTHFGIIHDKGSFDMAILGVDVTSVVELGKDADGHLSVSSANCVAQVGDVEVRFHGGASWIFKRFVKHFKKRISKEIENRGEFFSEKTRADPPFEAQPFTMPEQQAFMLSLGLSEFTLNSASYVYYSYGVFQRFIDDSMIPPGFPLHLNTSLMGPYVPQLPKMFPGLLMDLHVYARDTPMFSFQPGAVKLGIQGAVKAFAIQPNGTQTPLFQLNIDLTLSSKVWIADGKVKGSVSTDNFTLTLAGSEVGSFGTDALENIARKVVEMGLEILNKHDHETCDRVDLQFIVSERLGRGLVLPRLKRAQLVNSVLKVQEGFIALFSDADVFLTDRGFNQQN